MKSRLLILLLFVLKVYNGTAQDTIPLSDADGKIAKQAAANGIKARMATPYSAASLSNFFSNISVSSFLEEGVNGKLELQGKLGASTSGGITIDQKISQGSVKATPLNLTGISPGTTVEINLQKMFWHPTFNRSIKQIQAMEEVMKNFAKENNIEDHRTVGLREISLKGTEAQKRQAIKTFNTVSGSNPVFVNAKLGFTKTSFDYATDSISLKTNSDAYITPTFTFSLIKTLANDFTVTGYFALSYNYSQSYTAADDLTFTVPFGTTQNYYSTTVAFGKPEKTTSNNIIAEYRRNIYIGDPNGKYSSLVISPSATLGIDSKMLAIFLPVYFIKGADENGKQLDGLQGGVRFGYITSTGSGQASSFKQGFTAQLIISAPLSILTSF